MGTPATNATIPLARFLRWRSAPPRRLQGTPSYVTDRPELFNAGPARAISVIGGFLAIVAVAYFGFNVSIGNPWFLILWLAYWLSALWLLWPAVQPRPQATVQ